MHVVFLCLTNFEQAQPAFNVLVTSIHGPYICHGYSTHRMHRMQVALAQIVKLKTADFIQFFGTAVSLFSDRTSVAETDDFKDRISETCISFPLI